MYFYSSPTRNSDIPTDFVWNYGSFYLVKWVISFASLLLTTALKDTNVLQELNFEFKLNISVVLKY